MKTDAADFFEALFGALLVGCFALLVLVLATCVVFEIRDWRRRPRARRRRRIVVTTSQGGRWNA